MPQPHFSRLRLEFVERDDEAPVQVLGKWRVVGPWSAFGGPSHEIRRNCIRMAGRIQLTVRASVESHLTVAEIHGMAAQEFGHVLGLEHCLRCDSMMNDQGRTLSPCSRSGRRSRGSDRGAD